MNVSDIILIMIFLGMLAFSIFMICYTSGIQARKKKKSNNTSNKRNVINQYKIKSNNCNGCKKQEKCKYGCYTYDRIDKRQWTLWEKFMMLSMLRDTNSDETKTLEKPKEIDIYINKFAKQTKFNIEDLGWLEKYLEYEQKELNSYMEFGKCGKAYARYMKLGSLVKEIELKINNIKNKN